MWDYLVKTEKNILIYGRGNAAEAIVSELAKRGKKPAGFFASDGFVRAKEFLGYPVTSFTEAMQRFGKDSIVLLAFGTHREDVLQTIRDIASRTEFYAPDLPVAGEGLFDKQYYVDHEAQLQKTLAILADEQSRKVFQDVISYKLSGKIGYLADCETPAADNWALLAPAADKAYVDLGAYTGDTVLDYLAACSGPCDPSILAVEPEPRNSRKLKETVAAAGLTRCRCVQAVIGDSVGTAEISKGAGRGSRSTKTVPVCAETLDHLLDGARTDIVKMDVEGSEAAAIRGAAFTIQKYRPAMLIAAYHRTEDLWAIPQQVLALRPDYRVFLRKDPCLPAWEVNYYFV